MTDKSRPLGGQVFVGVQGASPVAGLNVYFYCYRAHLARFVITALDPAVDAEAPLDKGTAGPCPAGAVR
jgi:hypothetical protein